MSDRPLHEVVADLYLYRTDAAAKPMWRVTDELAAVLKAADEMREQMPRSAEWTTRGKAVAAYDDAEADLRRVLEGK